MRPFFIVGVQRSGTTLLSVMLGKHPDILLEKRSITFRIITCFKNLYELLPLNLEPDRKELLEWLVKSDQQGRLAELIDLEALDKCSNIRELIRHSIDKKLQEQGKRVWGDKSPNLQHYLHDLLLLIPDARILHIVRDGRANANSMSRRAFTHPLLAAQQWVDGNIFGLVNREILGADNYKIIRYEDLLQHPEAEMKAVCQFLELPYREETIRLADEALPEGKNYVKSFFDTSKMDNWKKQLAPKTIKKMESIQGMLLQKMGYELITTPSEFRYRPLSLVRRIFYNQSDNVKQLFRSKRMGMKNRQNVELHIPLKSRIYTFFRVLTWDFLSMPICKSLFSGIFFKEKYYQMKSKRK